MQGLEHVTDFQLRTVKIQRLTPKRSSQYSPPCSGPNGNTVLKDHYMGLLGRSPVKHYTPVRYWSSFQVWFKGATSPILTLIQKTKFKTADHLRWVALLRARKIVMNRSLDNTRREIYTRFRLLWNTTPNIRPSSPRLYVAWATSTSWSPADMPENPSPQQQHTHMALRSIHVLHVTPRGLSPSKISYVNMKGLNAPCHALQVIQDPLSG